jgi:hypothetical protein
MTESEERELRGRAEWLALDKKMLTYMLYTISQHTYLLMHLARAENFYTEEVRDTSIELAVNSRNCAIRESGVVNPTIFNSDYFRREAARLTALYGPRTSGAVVYSVVPGPADLQ